MIDRGDSKVRGRRSAGSKYALSLKARAGQRAEFADDRKMTRYGQPLRLVAAVDKIGSDATWFAVHQALSPPSGPAGRRSEREALPGVSAHVEYRDGRPDRRCDRARACGAGIVFQLEVTTMYVIRERLFRLGEDSDITDEAGRPV